MNCAAVMGRDSGSPSLPVEALAVTLDVSYLFLPLLSSLQSFWDQPVLRGQSFLGHVLIGWLFYGLLPFSCVHG